MTEQQTGTAVGEDRRGPGRVPDRPGPSSVGSPYERQSGPQSLADVLDRVLDKGIVIAGDIQVNLLDIELLTIKIRLLVASVDKAEEMGINWWKSDPMLSGNHERLEQENRELRERLEALEARHG
jgi:hypothetical protein